MILFYQNGPDQEFQQRHWLPGTIQGSLACSVLPQPSMANANDVYILQMRKLRHVEVRKQTSILGKQKQVQGYVCLCEFLIAGTC